MDDTARRVKLNTEELIGWVGEPYYVLPGSQHDGLWLADIVSFEERHYAEQWPDVVHVTGCEIATGQTYVVQAIGIGDDIADESKYSWGLELHTPSTWGDTVSGSGPSMSPPDGIVGLADIMSARAYFQGNTAIAPLTWLDIAPSTGSLGPDQVVGLGDIMGARGGFQGDPYPGDGPLNCP